MRSHFSIKPEYRHRYESEIEPYDDRAMKDEWQNEVYLVARLIADCSGAEQILDWGCGSGYKLLKYFGHLRTNGVEIEPCHSYLLETYPHRGWPTVSSWRRHPIHSNIVICADVLEHTRNPRLMLNEIKMYGDILVLSTPDRDMLEDGHDGPPGNLAHYREWSQPEFGEFVRSCGLDIISHMITNVSQCTQMIVCRKVE